ncbi:MAG TPA: hypothetical protein DCE44_18105 [Verrucomicrobiales bacterium]|nr:hypothetical protein [Verrucomicrobiales bacterium]
MRARVQLRIEFSAAGGAPVYCRLHERRPTNDAVPLANFPARVREICPHGRGRRSARSLSFDSFKANL